MNVESKHKCKYLICDGTPHIELNGLTYCEYLEFTGKVWGSYTPTPDGVPLQSERHKRNTGRWWITDFFLRIFTKPKLTESNLESFQTDMIKCPFCATGLNWEINNHWNCSKCGVEVIRYYNAK